MLDYHSNVSRNREVRKIREKNLSFTLNHYILFLIMIMNTARCTKDIKLCIIRIIMFRKVCVYCIKAFTCVLTENEMERPAFQQ